VTGTIGVPTAGVCMSGIVDDGTSGIGASTRGASPVFVGGPSDASVSSSDSESSCGEVDVFVSVSSVASSGCGCANVTSPVSESSPVTGAIGPVTRMLGRFDRMRSSAAAWSAAPIATASSGLMSVRGALPKNAATRSRTYGIFVVPPTSTTSSTSTVRRPASFSDSSHTGNVRSTTSTQPATS
jgi:hypothetical protein